ncbi:MAG: FAD/NAD(P)-binding oxidoreductase, partial [SAR324 cluster bacterium]|nr:FAD/NAD(P)-binding oxidoreductase [SAR324 cluster bacterium]
MNQTYDFVIIGAGPAGLAAALEADKQKLSVLVLDEQPEAGGQIYRSISTTKLLRPETYSLLGPDYQVGHTLEHSFRQSGVHYIPGASVWQVEPDRSVLYLRNGDVRQVGARRLLIATGAMERPVPIPGWTLPGVMGAAAADVLLKSSGTVPSGRVVLAGSGPLLWLTASRLAAADVDISAVLETTTFLNYIQALPHLPRALLAGEYLLKGLRLKRQVRSAGIPVHSGIHDLHAGGSHRLETVCYTHHKQSQKIESETLLLHEGVVSHTQLT